VALGVCSVGDVYGLLRPIYIVNDNTCGSTVEIKPCIVETGIDLLHIGERIVIVSRRARAHARALCWRVAIDVTLVSPLKQMQERKDA
jgi:hypothetical protein